MLDFSNRNERLNKIGRDCEMELKKIGIHCGNVVLYTTQDFKDWGQCQRFGVNMFIISINKVLTMDGYEDGLKSTILHELLHTCPGCYDHGDEWKSKANVVKQKLGIKISIFDTYGDKKIKVEDYMKIHSYKYAIQCEKCGAEYFRKRKSCFTENYMTYRCSVCGGELICIFQKN